MPKKRKVDCEIEISSSKIYGDPSITVDRSEILELTKAAKSWDFTCTFCFKRFPSAQAMGGHQNAHKGERLEEKRLFVKDPIGYRKRAYLLAMKSGDGSSSSVSSLKMVKPNQINDPHNYLGVEVSSRDIHFSNEEAAGGIIGETVKELFPLVVTKNFLGPKINSVAAESRVGSYAAAEGAIRGKVACLEADHGINIEKLDLTLKL